MPSIPPVATVQEPYIVLAISFACVSHFALRLMRSILGNAIGAGHWLWNTCSLLLAVMRGTFVSLFLAGVNSATFSCMALNRRPQLTAMWILTLLRLIIFFFNNSVTAVSWRWPTRKSLEVSVQISFEGDSYTHWGRTFCSGPLGELLYKEEGSSTTLIYHICHISYPLSTACYLLALYLLNCILTHGNLFGPACGACSSFTHVFGLSSLVWFHMTLSSSRLPLLFLFWLSCGEGFGSWKIVMPSKRQRGLARYFI